MSKYAEFYRERIPKHEIIKKLDLGGFYNMQNLSDDELDLFDTKDNFLTIISHPLLYMVKQDLRDIEWQEANPGNQVPVESSKIENKD
jgi:hypothetical protein